jgi:hypothetical protein
MNNLYQRANCIDNRDDEYKLKLSLMPTLSWIFLAAMGRAKRNKFKKNDDDFSDP